MIISMDNYYRILGINPQCTIHELKQAYRQKAKQLHPDKNKSTNAHTEFINLNEAYEYLLKLKTGVVTNTHTSANHVEWMHQEREKTKARARAYAQMQYDEFIQSAHYKSLSSISAITDFFYLFFVVALLLVLPVIITINLGISYFFSGLILLITIPLAVKIIRSSTDLKFGNFVTSVFHVIQTRWFLIITGTLINIVTLLKIGLQTLLPVWMILTISVLTILSTYGITQWGIKTKTKRLHYFNLCSLLPLLFNLYLTINFVFSSNPLLEKYHFENELQPAGNGYQETPYIHLENNTYHQYPGIRMFMDYEQMKLCNTITYTFADGLLGLRVMTDYKFTLE